MKPVLNAGTRLVMPMRGGDVIWTICMVKGQPSQRYYELTLGQGPSTVIRASELEQHLREGRLRVAAGV